MRWQRTLMLCTFAAAVAAAASHGTPTGHGAPDLAARAQFASGGHARLAYQVRHQHAWVRGRLQGGDSVWVVMDTGASASVLDLGVAARLGLPSSDGPPATGGGGRQASRIVPGVRLELDGVSFTWPRMVALDLASITRATGRSMDVILGHDLFRDCVVRFDPAAGMVDIWSPRAAPRAHSGTVVPLTLVGHHPYIEAELRIPGRAPLRGRFVLDTGATSAVILHPDVVARDSLVAAFPRTLATLARGVGGEIWNRVGRAGSLAIGDLVFQGPTVLLPLGAEARISVPGSIGNIGGQIMGRCRTTFDYPRLQVGFEPLPGFAEPFESNMAGIALTPEDGGFRVRAVEPDSPGADAGLREGDLVVDVDGDPATGVDPVELRRSMGREGGALRLGVRRGDHAFTLTLALRRLI